MQNSATHNGVRVERKGEIVTIILDRSAVRNAVDGPTAHALADAFRAFENDPSARVAVLFGDNGVFCAGADLSAVASGDATRSNRMAPSGDAPMGVSRMCLSKPVIAAVAGFAVAGGLELALWCDLRVAEEDSTFGVFCRRWGVPLIDGGTIRLPRIIGHGRAMDMILTGRPVSATEALAMGLVNRVVPKGKAKEAAENLAKALCTYPQQCMNADRLSAIRQWGLPQEEALGQEFEGGAKVLAEGITGAVRFASGAGRHGAFEAKL